MNINGLKEELTSITEMINSIYSGAGREKRETSLTEIDEINKCVARGDEIKVQIATYNRAKKLGEWANKTDDIPEKPTTDPSIPNPKRNRGFHTMGEFFRCVAEAADGTKRVDPRLMRATGLSEGVPADGGFLLQTDFSKTLLDLAFETGKLATRCAKIKISNTSNSIKIPGVNETSREDGSRQGGIQAYWKDEAALKTASQPSFRQIQLTLNKLIGLCYATDELLADTTALESWIKAAFPREFGFKIDDGIFNGTGAGQPLGILTSGALVSVAKETGQAAATFIAENVMKMYARMLPDSIPNATWYINQEVWPQVFQLHQAIGTGGTPMFIPPGRIADAPYGMLMGRPIMPIEHCAALGTVGDVVLADLSYYYFADKGGLRSDQSIHVKFTYDETCYRFIYRCDGQPQLASPITPYKGTDTLSPFVALATRSTSSG